MCSCEVGAGHCRRGLGPEPHFHSGEHSEKGCTITPALGLNLLPCYYHFALPIRKHDMV